MCIYCRSLVEGASGLGLGLGLGSIDLDFYNKDVCGAGEMRRLLELWGCFFWVCGCWRRGMGYDNRDIVDGLLLAVFGSMGLPL